MTLEEILDVLEGDRDRHMIGEPATTGDLNHVEAVLGHRLPAGLRSFLQRFGGGIFYERHEVFGCRRLIIHDIELVPDVLTMCRRLEAAEGVPNYLLPFHRADGIIHLVDLRTTPAGESAVLSWEGSRTFPTLTGFLEAVLVSSRDHPSRPRH